MIRLSLCTTLILSIFVAAVHGTHNRRQDAAGHWIAGWTSMPQLTEPANLPPAPFNTSGVVFANSTIRQTVRVTAASSRVRLRLSNAFGGSSLPITSVSIALPVNGSGSSAIDVDTAQPVLFGGEQGVIIPNGALAVSDAVDIDVSAAEDLTVSLYLSSGQTGNDITSHPGSRTTSWMVAGDHIEAETLEGISGVQSVAHWYFISTLEVWVPAEYSTLAIVGDSITDGRGSTTNGNDRWPDQLFTRIQEGGLSVALANQAAGGNRVLADGLGPNALGRFDRDVLAQPGVRYVLVFEGVNDIGGAASTTEAQMIIGDQLIYAYKQFALRAHAAELAIFGATITPFCAPGFNATAQPYCSEVREATRQRVNTWIRESDLFDGVVDFDAAVRDPEDETRLKVEYDSGDFLHLNPAGYAAMADAFPLELLSS
ncbi:extracellular GDSL-like lipase/acylhydrolase [Cylindrobasidium torrendii FP15055 ss-10]|uniref:Extracellular GDSL-like lipase/acylhydrolase n=1 Tax=Cylindrobasidium torrendii FP15055 ss-10 TaxID=1314674 RepID=A0A0D7AZ52_9AGAR|nr:extracellular GDSL-like lipase/acylhydrolase [Cylindrobasidium torrendii FP15055 ss-10]